MSECGVSVMPGTYSNLNVHIVFSTKRREPLINASLEPELHRYIAGIISNEGGQVLAINGTKDHLHIVVKLKPKHVVPDLLKKIKANSSKWVNDHRKIDGRYSWQVGYGIFSVSQSQLNKVILYVKNQKQHHQTKTFQDELVILLEKNGIDYDPTYLWD